MANDIRYDFAKMNAAITKIENLTEKYKNAAETFDTDFLTAINGWEGASKDKMLKLMASVKSYTGTQIPQAVGSLAELLKNNVEQMQSADQQIADNIPSELT